MAAFLDKYGTMLKSMLSGTGTTISIFFFTLLFSIPLALFVAMGRMSKNKFLSQLTNIFLLIIRGTPLMLQLLIVYFVPKLIAVKLCKTTIDWPAYLAAIVAFAINYAAYFAEIYRGGIESIPKGQYEACKVLGYTKGQTFFKIILPQVIKRIVPAMGNEVITLVKDTSLVTILSIQELMFVAKSSSNRMVSFTPLLIAGIFYFVMNWVVSITFQKLEKKLSYYN
jgi:polar amino acid transport system permease protein